MSLERMGQRVVARVPDELLRRSAYPAVLDPFIGPDHEVDAPVYGEAYDTVGSLRLAFDGTYYRAVWADEREGHHIHTARYLPDGSSPDPYGVAVPPSGAAGHPSLPALAASSVGALVVYRRYESSGGDFLEAALLGSDAAPMPPFGLESGTPPRVYYPAVATDGMDYLLAYIAAGLHIQRISGAGELLGAPSYVAYETTAPSVVWDGTQYMLAWTARTGVTGAFGARVSASGVLLDSPRSSSGPIRGPTTMPPSARTARRF